MGAWDTITDTVGTLSGNIEKAIIAVQDMRDRGEIKQEEAAKAGTAKKTGVGGGLGDLASGAMEAAKQAEELAKKAEELANKTGLGSLTKSVKSALGQAAMLNMESSRLFSVQFNPSDLQLTGYGGGRVPKTDYIGNRNASVEPMKARITLSVKLIFDQVDPQDAFMGDKFQLSATNVLKGAGKAVVKLAGKKVNSVQSQVEGFIAALQNENTREITFAWGSLCYTGILNHISSQYTMFSVTGEPIRGVVQLSMVCVDEEIGVSSMGAWEEQYNRAFGAGAASYVQAAQKVGNLVNFSI